jgi:hypothetical protein
MLNHRDQFDIALRDGRRTFELMRLARVAAAAFIVVGVAAIAIVARPDALDQGRISAEEFGPTAGSGALPTRDEAPASRESEIPAADFYPEYMPHG